MPIADSKLYISGYPRELTLYKSNASPYFWVRYYADGKTIKRSTKTESKREAIAFAKAFYNEINLRRSQGYSLVQTSSFRSIATEMLKSIKAQVARNARTSQEMIDRFYASQLKGKENIGMIRSHRKRRSFD